MTDLKAKLSKRLSKQESLENKDYEIIEPKAGQNSQQELQVVPDFAISFAEAKSRLTALKSFVAELMIPGVDYGIIPGCNKPSLFKSGAEKLCDIFGFSKLVEITNRVEEWENGFLSYEVKVTLINKLTGSVEAEGIGNCNSRERKYQKQDPYCISNSILKMAKKRALVDAVLSATRSSGLFTQDIEDISGFEVEPQKPTPSSSRVIPIPSDSLAGKQELGELFNIISKLQIPTDTAKALMKERYNISESKYLTKAQVSDFIKHLLDYKHAAI